MALRTRHKKLPTGEKKYSVCSNIAKQVRFVFWRIFFLWSPDKPRVAVILLAPIHTSYFLCIIQILRADHARLTTARHGIAGVGFQTPGKAGQRRR